MRVRNAIKSEQDAFSGPLRIKQFTAEELLEEQRQENGRSRMIEA
jgi:hypothetical protein